MTGRTPIGPLVAEHRTIERTIAVLKDELASVRKLRHADTILIEMACDFLRTYADRCHHGKEEDILFARLADKDLDPELAETMSGLLADHVRARSLTGGLVEANRHFASGETDALAVIERNIGELVELYPVHIAKEDRGFFIPCLAYLTEDERATMLEEFAEFDRSLIHEKYRHVVDELEARRAEA